MIMNTTTKGARTVKLARLILRHKLETATYAVMIPCYASLMIGTVTDWWNPAALMAIGLVSFVGTGIASIILHKWLDTRN